MTFKRARFFRHAQRFADADNDVADAVFQTAFADAAFQQRTSDQAQQRFSDNAMLEQKLTYCRAEIERAD